MDCLSPEILHAHADGALAPERQGEVGAHLRECAACRDAERALHRVEGYLRRGRGRCVDEGLASAVLDRALAGEFASGAPREDEAVIPDDPMREPDDRRMRAGVRPMMAACAAAVVVAAVVGLWTPDGAADRPGPHAETPAHERLIVALRSSIPDLHAIEFDASDLAASGFDGVDGRGAELHTLRSAWRGARGFDDQLRLIRFAALIRAPGFKAQAERLALRARSDGIAPALYAVAAFGGDEAARALFRVGRRREVTPGILAEALLRTGTHRFASRVWRLLLASSMDRPSAYDALHRMPGVAASRILVSAYLAGDSGAALRRVIAERPEALAKLRDAATESDMEVRRRALQMLGEAGDQDAIPLLARMLNQASTRSTAMTALHRVAQSGAVAAMLALARALPQVEDVSEWKRHPEAPVLGPLLRSLPAGAGGVFLLARQDSTRTSERRRFLIAAGLSGEPDIDSALSAALDRPQERRAALLGIALAGRRSALDSVRPFARSLERGTRRCALATIAALGGEQAAELLTAALRRTPDRRSVMKSVRLCRASWAAPVFVAGLRYRDTREASLAGLRRLFGDGGPVSGDPLAWKAWLRRADART